MMRLPLSNDNTFYHRTNNIKEVVGSGRLSPLTYLEKSSPKMRISIEPDRWGRRRETMSIKRAIATLRDQGKHPDKIFLTRNAPLEGEGYGKYIIEKSIRTPRESSILNLIPSEYTLRRPISLQRTSSVYVPSDEVEHLRGLNSKVNIKSMDEYEGDVHPATSFSSLLRKIKLSLGFEKAAAYTKSQVKKDFGGKAELVGSRGLGIDIGDKSDTDVLMVYKNKGSMTRAIERLSTKHGLTASKYNTPDKKRHVYSKDDLDLTFSDHPDAQDYIDSFLRANKNLSPESRDRIKSKKRSLQKAWIMPKYRYSKYKKDLDSKLGIKRL